MPRSQPQLAESGIIMGLKWSVRYPAIGATQGRAGGRSDTNDIFAIGLDGSDGTFWPARPPVGCRFGQTVGHP